jgi:molybdopterin/thiamine biosynthesis adenylyltransferase
MDEEQWRRKRDDRSLRYAGRRLDANRWITFTADEDYAHRYDGQVALVTATNLLGRMTPSVALAFPDAPLHERMPWSASTLHETILQQLQTADPFGRFCARAPDEHDVLVHFGRTGKGLVVHGLGWNAYLGSEPSPLPDAVDGNPIGAAFAAVVCASQLFMRDLILPTKATVIDTLTWRDTINEGPVPDPNAEIGGIFIVGVGSVGTAVLYFLTLATRRYSPTLIDGDRIDVHNLDRSPIFTAADVGSFKVDAAAAFLRARGLENAVTDARFLHESGLWTHRPSGTPDILVSAANEQNVRYHIESRFPPVQIYGTTGRNWQASLIRHTPLVDACSCCLFPVEQEPVPPLPCGTAPVAAESSTRVQVDAALPFLSFAAGLMAAAEIIKISLAGYPFSTNRVSLLSRPSPRLVAARIPQREDCLCRNRSTSIHRTMLEGSRFASLSHLGRA